MKIAGRYREFKKKCTDRNQLSLIIFSAFAILSLGLLLYFAMDESPEQNPQAREELHGRIADFIQKHPPLLRINFSGVYGGEIRYQVLHPIFNINQIFKNLGNTFSSANEGNEGEIANQTYLDAFGNKLNIETKDQVISQISNTEITEIKTSSPLIVTRDFLLVKEGVPALAAAQTYMVFELRAFQKNLKGSNYDLIPMALDAYCLERIGNACWTYSSKHFISYIHRYSLAVKILLAISLLLILGSIGRYLYAKSKEHEKHRLALQVLSHEFRTPVASLLLMIESMSKSINSLSPADQDLFTRMSSEVYQLQRIVEMSRNYLQSNNQKISLREVEISSINAWIHDFVSDFQCEIKLQLLEEDQSIKADPFWLKLVLTNLVQNAINHGKPPVSIKISDNSGKIKITVEDQGSCEFSSLKEMTEAFAKGKRSQGMGLGLNIASAIAKTWGSEIKFSKHPTSFSLDLNQGKM